MTTLPVPMGAVDAAVTVTVVAEPVFTLAELKVAVTPVGVAAFRVTVPL